MRIIHLDETDSTDLYIRQFFGGGEDIAVIARRQTAGRGTKGRSFLSEEGGVYCSVLKFYGKLPVSDAFRIMTHAAVSVCRTVEAYGVFPQIKWPNDIFLGRQKLCGIDIENFLDGPFVRASIVGIGINVTNDVSALGGIAVSLKDVLPDPPPPEEVAKRLIARYEEGSTFEEYLSRVGFMGKIVVVEGERSYPATARRILPDGRLEVETADGVRALGAAEIGIRF